MTTSTIAPQARTARRGPGGVRASGVGLVRAARPRQWVKNVLVLAAPLVAGRLTDPGVWPALAAVFAAFCLAASGIYLINDVLDADADRAHPTKRHRPIAAGIVDAPVAVAAAAVLLAAAPALAATAGPSSVLLVAVYAVVQVAYCVWLKHQPVLDIGVVASGFLMRAMAGGVATGIALSPWFLLTAGFGSLFMAAGKRAAERELTDRSGVAVRAVLNGYTASYLRFVWMSSATAVIAAYSLWAVEIRGTGGGPWAVLSIVPFVLAVLRYAADVDRGRAGAPEDLALGDRVLQLLALLWAGLLLVAVHG